MRKLGDLVYLYDTTLRDGTQGEGISLTLEDKLKITAKLDELGVHYIEGGWPGSNPKDLDYFKRVKELSLKQAKVSAFGSTRMSGITVDDDPNIRALLEADTPVVTIFGKSWDFHVTKALNTTLEENINMIWESVQYLKAQKREVVYDAEHFFDGYKANPDYALATLKAASNAGADWIVLCDTNGGALPGEIEEVLEQLGEEIDTPLGIHVHCISIMLFRIFDQCHHQHSAISTRTVIGMYCNGCNMGFPCKKPHASIADYPLLI
jgi:2-isopropylmalate synthase